MNKGDGHPFIRQDWLDVGAGHQLFLAQYGDPQGVPVLYLHGGPGAGCSAEELKLFIDDGFHIYMLDQRAAGRSKPCGVLEHNNLLELLKDIERVRNWAKVDAWCLLGGSFGATLGYLYSCIYPKRVLSQVYWGMFIPSPEGADWLYGPGGAAQIFSTQYREFTRGFNGTLDALFEQFHQDFHAPCSDVRDHSIRRWLAWELELAAPGCTIHDSYAEQSSVLARLELHYAKNDYFGAYALMKKVGAALTAPTVILQGELDWVCPQPIVDKFLACDGPELLSSRLVKSGYHTLSDERMCSAVAAAVSQMGRYVKSL
ncbi:alpha/beta fold hydrolase [Shewanella colwelliana]|uniref:alpha/beta fold hydrolase n=1 Tax=Shewanella colwelliana TaxID=23 RepID=UPI0022AF9315|nr:alpha/beta fold hydrolase [Shewanella colwelliana]MCZ4337952.1 alpha/beta fold hydrolase [Shewanella colwelliana]